MIRAGIRFKGGSAPPREIMSDLGYELEPFMEPWVVEWAEWDNETRPWPDHTSPPRSVQLDVSLSDSDSGYPKSRQSLPYI